MDYFKQLGSYSLAGSVLTVALFGAFGVSGDFRSGFVLTVVVIGGLLAFSLCLCCCAYGMYALAENRASPRSTFMVFGVDKTVRFTRRFSFYCFTTGAIGFFLAGYAMLSAASFTLL